MSDKQSLQDELTEREMEVVRLIAEGMSNQEVAHRLVLTLGTVKWYNTQIFGKLGVKNRTQAIMKAQQLGLLEVDEHTPPGTLPKLHLSHNLPVLSMPLIGREDELARVQALLADPACRLLSLVGPGGIGKTYLAVEAARQQLRDFEDGVYFVSLTPLSSVDDIIPTIGNAMNFNFSQGEDPKRQLLGFLRERGVLLVLDNFDNLLDGVGVVVDLLQAAPFVKVISTSRIRMNVQEETVFRLEGMQLPAEAQSESVLENGAVRLFIYSARRVRPDFEPRGDDLKNIIRICQQVEGMPLGIVLAAAWTEMLTPGEIAYEIARSVDFLQTDTRNMPERHRSMRGVFESGWKMLSDVERMAFARLSVFRGGFTREAAEAMGTDLRTLMALVNKTLLRRDPGGRYQIHELLRQFAVEQLEAIGNAEAARDTHSRFYAEFLHQRAAEDAHHLEVLSEIEADFENARAAWHWAVERRDADTIDRALNGLYFFCARRGRYKEALRLFDPAIEFAQRNPGALQQETMLRLSEYRGETRGMIGQFDGAAADLRLALEAARAEGDTTAERNLLVKLGFVFRNADQIDKAMGYLGEALEVARSVGDHPMVAETLFHLGTCAWSMGANREARRHYQEAVDTSQSLGLTDRIAMQAVHGLGEAHWAAGRSRQAIECATQSLEMARVIGDKSYESENLQNIGWASVGSVGSGDYAQALRAFTASLAISEAGHLWHAGPTAFGLGFAKASLGDYEEGLAYIRHGLEYVETLGQIRYLQAALDVMGHLYQDLNLLEKAEAVHQQAVEWGIKSKTGFWLPRAQANLAIDRLRRGNMSVGDALRSALDAALTNEQGFHAVRCVEGLAELAILRHEPENALRYANQLHALAEPGGMQEMLAQARRWRGEAWLVAGDLGRAEDELRQSLTLATDTGRLRLTWDIHAALAKVYRARGQEELAAQHEASVRQIVGRIDDNLRDPALRAGLPPL